MLEGAGDRAAAGLSSAEPLAARSRLNNSCRIDAMPPPPEEPNRLDQIDTRWSLMRLAHQPSISVAGPAFRMTNATIARLSGSVMQTAKDLSEDLGFRSREGKFSGRISEISRPTPSRSNP